MPAASSNSLNFHNAQTAHAHHKTNTNLEMPATSSNSTQIRPQATNEEAMISASKTSQVPHPQTQHGAHNPPSNTRHFHGTRTSAQIKLRVQPIQFWRVSKKINFGNPEVKLPVAIAPKLNLQFSSNLGRSKPSMWAACMQSLKEIARAVQKCAMALCFC